ncbi:MAG TPA: hypothetical protein VFE24_14825 [Pirellulales bacterium]|nr:hypothetical protein [Pirellulales bacterium]
MLELMIASSLLTTIVTATAVVMRSASTAWQDHQDDYTRIEQAQACVRQMVRNLRQASSVASISAANNTSGSLSVISTSGATYTWTRDNATNQVNFNNGSGASLLAENITALSFTAYQEDGVTATTNLAQIHSIKTFVTVQLPHDANITRTFSCWTWIRPW